MIRSKNNFKYLSNGNVLHKKDNRRKKNVALERVKNSLNFSIVMGERKEAFFRILVLVVSGIVLGLWGYFVFALAIVNWFIAVFAGRRNKSVADLAEYWNTEHYKFDRYMTGVSNTRPFPFTDAERISKFKK